MATYVFSDVHGHAAPLDRILARISPTSSDELFCLGDLVDRGPDPIGCISICRDLERCHVLMGNHERMLLQCVVADDDIGWINWYANGGNQTAKSLGELEPEETEELVTWISRLPLFAHTKVAGRDYILVHAGIRPGAYPTPADGVWTDEQLDALLNAQTEDDLLWIRSEFLERPTGLVDAYGRGPVVVAGHTPTLLASQLADVCDRSPEYAGQLRIVRLGACEATGGVADRIAIDTGAGSAPGLGCVSVLRLDDGEEFYERFVPGD